MLQDRKSNQVEKSKVDKEGVHVLTYISCTSSEANFFYNAPIRRIPNQTSPREINALEEATISSINHIDFTVSTPNQRKRKRSA